MINKCLYDYIQEFPDLSETEVEIKFIKDTIEKIGKVKVSLEEAEEIWSDHSLSLWGHWNSDFTYGELEKLSMASIDSLYVAHVLEKNGG